MTKFDRGAIFRGAARGHAAMWFLTVAGLAVAFLPRLTHRGMFFDGVTYAAISRNLAIGRGTFWDPHYTETLHPHFHEHPPLGLWLPSLGFRLLGDHLYVEGLYDALCALLMVALIVVIWKRTSSVRLKPDTTGVATENWLPVLLWIVPPVASWTIVGNLFETTLMVFTTAAVLMIVRAVQAEGWRAVGWAAASGLAVAAAFMTKGPVALFPIVTPGVLWIWGRCERSRAFGLGCVQWGTLTLVLAALLANDAARGSFAAYLEHQLNPALSGAVASLHAIHDPVRAFSQVLLPTASSPRS
jgi:4-amino-4-deoxy-L-arabinose transferase-like glycosyltransferase